MKTKFADLGQFLREKREAGQFTQADVADKLGCKSQFISNWERGAASPPWKMLKAVIKMYKISDKEIVRLLVSDYERAVRKQLGFKK